MTSPVPTHDERSRHLAGGGSWNGTSPPVPHDRNRPALEAVAGRNGADARARRIANVVLVSAGVVAACMVLANPKGRRIARRVVRAWLGASVPMYLLAEVGRAWVETGRRA
jgi:hypothetical protein